MDEAIAQVNLGIVSVTPDSVNQDYGNKYASLGAMNKALKPLLKAAGLYINHCVVSSSGDGTQYLHTYVNHLASGESEVYPCILIHDGTMQGFVAACTYAKRLNLSNIFDLAVDHDDDGRGADPEAVSTRKREQKTVTTKSGRSRAAGETLVPVLKPAQREKHGVEIAALPPEEAYDYILRLSENFALSEEDMLFLNSKIATDEDESAE